MSKQTRRICLDALQWKKINLSKKIVPAEFIKYVLDHGCQYLNLSGAKITGNLNLDKISYSIKYLNLADCKSDPNFVKKLIVSCKYIQKLSLRHFESFRDDAKNILKCINPNGLQTLDLTLTSGLDLNYIQKLFKSKTLTEISFLSNRDLQHSRHLVDYIINNLPKNIKNLSIAGLMCITDEHLAFMNKRNENLSINHRVFEGCLGKIDPNHSFLPEEGFWDVPIRQLELFPSMPDKLKGYPVTILRYK